MDESLLPMYRTASGDMRASYQSGGVPVPVAAQPQPFNLKFAPPPAVNLPPLDINMRANTNAVQAAKTPSAPRAAAPAAPDNGLPKGIPSNAIPVIRGMELTYDIPGTGQRLYPTLSGRPSEFSPEQRFELARYTEPAQIGADASVRGAGIRAGADIQGARIAAENNRFSTLATLGATPRPFGSEVVPDPTTGLGISVPTYGVPKIDRSTGAVEGFTPIGAAAQRAGAMQEGRTGVQNGRPVKVVNGKLVYTDGK